MKLALTAAMGALMIAGGALAQPLTTYPLPAEVRYPEGVALDPATGALYTASAETGLLVRLDPATGRSTVVAPAGTGAPVMILTAVPGDRARIEDWPAPISPTTGRVTGVSSLAAATSSATTA